MICECVRCEGSSGGAGVELEGVKTVEKTACHRLRIGKWGTDFYRPLLFFG